MSKYGFRFLHPHHRIRLDPTYASAYRRFFSTSRLWYANAQGEVARRYGGYEKRISQLKARTSLDDYYPRLGLPDRKQRILPKAFHSKYAHLSKDEVEYQQQVTVYGRVQGFRSSSSKLVFVDLVDETGRIQCLCDYRALEGSGATFEAFSDFQRVVWRGDWYSVTGHPTRTTAGELSIRATQVPQPLSVSLHHHPTELLDREKRMRRRHVDLIANPTAGDILRLRHHVERFLCNYFHDEGFVKVSTPLLVANAGGATARPFETVATELSDTKLNLRIAPELFLKRLVVGGMAKVFEIGPVFRNEGVDATHNPEFTMCEFYEAFATLPDLMMRTETFFAGLASSVESATAEHFPSLSSTKVALTAPFKRIEFVPALESAIKRPLPDLRSPSAQDELIRIFEELELPFPAEPNIPHLLDDLATRYIEPLCIEPTFVLHHPEQLSPLAKSFCDSQTKQVVSARAELFINGTEYVNCYEEENSPFEQRRKFEDQARMRISAPRATNNDGAANVAGSVETEGHAIDENYLEALEWGLPPTGGLGCGVDRLVMLFAGAKRIADVLSFGTVRNVAGLVRR